MSRLGRPLVQLTSATDQRHGTGKTGMNSHGERPDSDIAETSIFTASPTLCGVIGTPAEPAARQPGVAEPWMPGHDDALHRVHPDDLGLRLHADGRPVAVPTPGTLADVPRRSRGLPPRFRASFGHTSTGMARCPDRRPGLSAPPCTIRRSEERPTRSATTGLR